jgi:formiminotetrahydrofolate cyclodeaminase
LFSFITDEPLSGIVAAAAVSAAMALDVLRAVLEIAARKQTSERLPELIREAQAKAERLAQLAREDGIRYAAYLQARREHSPELQAALRAAIETPLESSRTAAAAIDLCDQALPYMRGAIAADVHGAAALLAGAVRAILCTVEENLRGVEDGAFVREVGEETERLRALL